MTVKRIFDVCFAAAAVVFLGPLMFCLAVVIRMNSSGPAIYRSPRVGRDGEIFGLWKFRTMAVDADQNGPSSTADGDPRITTIGHFLRRWKLDELPQFINVLRGEMSIVGPRPQVAWAVDRYDDNERRLLSIRPGITDYASIRFHDEASILAGHDDADAAYLELIEPEKIRLGLQYVDNHGLIVDLKIIWSTIRAAFFQGRSE